MNRSRSIRLAIAAAVVLSAGAGMLDASADTAKGSISGVIDLTTGKSPARIPETANIQVIVLIDGKHPVPASTVKLVAGSNSAIGYKVDGLDVNVKRYLVTVTASPPIDEEPAGPGFWSVQFLPKTAMKQAGAYAVSLSAQHPNATAVNFTARGAKIPPSMPLPPPGHPTGYVSGTIALDAAGVRFPANTALQVQALRNDGPNVTIVGAAELGTISTDANGMRSVPFSITGLPIDLPLTISVGTTPGPGASPLPTGFAHIIRFRVHAQDGGSDSPMVTLTASGKGLHLDFEPYELEVFPLPQGTR